MKRRHTKPKALSDILKKTLAKWQLTQPIRRHEVMTHWGTLAGSQIAERARPTHFQGPDMIVEVDHPAWIQELKFLKDHLLKKISETYPESKIKDLKFVLK